MKRLCSPLPSHCFCCSIFQLSLRLPMRMRRQYATTVTNYIQAYYTGDAHRMEQTLHPTI